MLSGEGNQNGEKTTTGLISIKTTLHVQHTFFVHFFALVLHDHNVKLPETSQLHVLWRKCRTCCCSIFFSLAHFHLGGRQDFSFSHGRLKIFMLFFQQIALIFRSSSLSLFFSLKFTGLSPALFFLYIPNLWT